jgi:hypothetical protein
LKHYPTGAQTSGGAFTRRAARHFCMAKAFARISAGRVRQADGFYIHISLNTAKIFSKYSGSGAVNLITSPVEGWMNVKPSACSIWPDTPKGAFSFV